MNEAWGIIIGIILSGLICSFLLYILNKTSGIFNPIQKDLDKLNNGTRRILSFYIFISLVLIITLLSLVVNINAFQSGLILGFLNSVKDTCFKANIVENNLKTRTLE